jgi:hypothetical protein
VAAIFLGPRDPFGGSASPDRYRPCSSWMGGCTSATSRRAVTTSISYTTRFFIEEIPDLEGEVPARQVRPITEEFQQPEGSVLIARDQVVVVVQNLRPNSEVAEAIDQVGGTEERLPDSGPVPTD